MIEAKRKKPRLVAERRYTNPADLNKKKSTVGKKSTPNPTEPKTVTGRILPGILWLPHTLLRLIWAFSWRIAMVLSFFIVGTFAYQYQSLHKVTDLLDGRARGSVTLKDRYGEIFAWRGEQYGGLIAAKDISNHLRNAIIATEDRRFFSHIGISPRGIASAIRINLREGRGPLSGHGGSTITQQVAKLLCLGQPYVAKVWASERLYEKHCRQGSLWRKIREAIFALAMEAKYSKAEILTIYLNRAFLGAGARGFEAASQRYFGKSTKTVTPAESAMLAGLLVAPTRYAPTNNLTRSQKRAAVIIGLMRDQSYLTQAQATTALRKPAQLSPAAKAHAGGYFADWVMSSGPAFFTRNTTEDVIIKTTLDQRIQTAAEAALRNIFLTKVSENSQAQAAIVVMSPDGAVRAMVGGRDKTVAGVFNRATQAKRQTGSAFKPFVYATALELGYAHNDTVEDAPLTLNIPGSGAWTPKNYTKKFRGMVTLTDALAGSLNIPAVRVSEAIGRNNVRRIAIDFGITSTLAQGPALALGASESTLIEMVGAYAGILNGGSSVKPYGLRELRLAASQEAVMWGGGGIGERVIRTDVARELIFMMHKVVEEGTGRRARLEGVEVAGKTGTTQAARDAWFIGFSADYVAGVWIGYDDNSPLSGVTG
ncbi:MAG: transglycosylase domain-containing protein, partial [Paracoccaceae bacterium]|nr:transglycosylase domain-containing protein [Paracoccaceae bacterium]